VSAAVETASFEAAVAAASLTDEETAFAKERAEEGSTVEDAIAMTVAMRDTQPEHEHKPEPEPPAEPGLTQAEGEKITDAATKAAEKYLALQVKRLEPLGLGLVPCPLCVWPGVTMVRHANEVTSDVKEAVLTLIGETAAPEFKASAQYRICDECDGQGEVLTGAKKAISRTAPCGPCGGKGFLMGTAPVLQLAPPNGSSYPGADQPFQPLPQGISDAWGRPAGHPHWGRDPREIGV
jgi:hypothetical protein